MLHTYTPNQCPYKVSTFYTLQFLRYSPGKVLKVKVTTARSKVKPRSHHNVAHLHLPINVPTVYINFLQITVSKYSPDKILKLKVTTVRSNQGHTMMLHTPQPMYIPSINFLHLTVFEIQPRQTLSRPPKKIIVCHTQILK